MAVTIASKQSGGEPSRGGACQSIPRRSERQQAAASDRTAATGHKSLLPHASATCEAVPLRLRGYNSRVNARLEQQIVDACRAYPGVVAVYLFGSIARGTDKPSSDVDVAVLFDRPPERRLNGPRFELEGELESALGRPVDLIVLNDVPPDLGIRVLREGRPLLEHDRVARIAFEVGLRNEAFDLEPILLAYRASLPSRRRWMWRLTSCRTGAWP